jgi:DnaK suppressor protein
MSAQIDDPKRRLLEMREGISRRLAKIDGDIHRKEGALEMDSQEQAVQLENDETMDALDEAARRELAQIDHALKDLEAGRYGICRSCGALIGAGRMEALPFAITCVACAEKAEQGA